MGTLGRGSFIPLCLRGGASSDEYGGLPGGGVSLMDVVRIKDGYQDIGQHLLGDVVLVPDLQEGLDLWKANGHFKRIVTQDGDLIDPDGVISGGRTNGSGGAILRKKREIRELQGEVESLSNQYQRKKEESEEILRKLRFSETDLDRINQALYQLDMDILKGEKDGQQAMDALKRNGHRLRILEAEIAEIDSEAGESSAEETRCAQKESELAERQASNESKLSALSRESREQAAEKELQRDALNRSEVEIQLIREKISGLFSSRRQIEEKVASVKAFLHQKEQECRECEEKILKISGDIETNERRMVQLEQAKGEMETLLASVTDKIQEGRSLLQQKEECIKEVRDRLEEDRRLKEEYQIRLVEIGLRKKNVQDQAWQKHRSDITDAENLELSDEEDGQIQSKLEQLRLSIERIGEVNPTAIEEFETLQKRHLFYQEQYDDLKNSLESLKRLIQRINRITKKRFMEAFVQINERFQQVFPRLFNGGRAFLQMDNENDPLEAGVEIVAQPPGKKLQNINLLSGGEKSMAALALVLAIFEYKPSPFCVLDEVDAALDDVNVLRFTEILKGISRHAQFIVITHNKQTMQIADTLYGVTMESPGVSQLVSVRMN
jgi:chromosome segregation protein